MYYNHSARKSCISVISLVTLQLVLRHTPVVFIIRRRAVHDDVSIGIQPRILRTRFNAVLIVQPLDLLARDTQLILGHPHDRLTFPKGGMVKRVRVHAGRVAVLFAGVRGVVVVYQGVGALAVAAFCTGGGGLVELGGGRTSADEGRVGVGDGVVVEAAFHVDVGGDGNDAHDDL